MLLIFKFFIMFQYKYVWVIEMLLFYLCALYSAAVAMPITDNLRAAVTKEAKIVDGVDRVSGTGLDQTLGYTSPDEFYGPEGMYLLIGTCFTALVDR